MIIIEKIFFYYIDTLFKPYMSKEVVNKAKNSNLNSKLCCRHIFWGLFIDPPSNQIDYGWGYKLKLNLYWKSNADWTYATVSIRQIQNHRRSTFPKIVTSYLFRTEICKRLLRKVTYRTYWKLRDLPYYEIESTYRISI